MAGLLGELSALWIAGLFWRATALLDSPDEALENEAVPQPSQSSSQSTISAKLAEIVLPDSAGRLVRLGSLWADRPAVIVFLRHYG